MTKIDEDIKVLGTNFKLSNDIGFSFDKFIDKIVETEQNAATRHTKSLKENEETNARKYIARYTDYAKNKIVFRVKK